MTDNGPKGWRAGPMRARRDGSARGAIAASVAVLVLVVASAPAEEPAASRRPRSKTATCLGGGCHGDVVDRKVTHGPVAQGKCEACHAYDRPDRHTFRLAAEPETLCVSCHQIQKRTVVHEPVRQGRCIGCHDPHGSEHRMMLLHDPTRGLCLSCHEQEGFADRAFKHGPVAAGACILCHEAHSSWEPTLLVEPVGRLCVSCHADVQRGVPGRHDHVHAPLADGRCADCHDPHASDIRNQLVATTPELCLGCHEPLRQELAGAAVVHGVVMQPGGCLGCHEPHRSQLPKLQRVGQTAMCLSCHDRAIETADGRMLTDMASLFADNPFRHGPIREDGCSACHRPHAGDRHNMLIKDYPPEFYAPYSERRYELCFNCHRPEMARDRRGTGLTRFRDQDVNLHWLHVNREKGRTCRACHEVHASRRPFHMRDSVPFGDRQWMLEIRFEKTASGGRCAPGCHAPRSYDHGLRAPAAGEAPGRAASRPAGDQP